jgi:hypothetical protein
MRRWHAVGQTWVRFERPVLQELDRPCPGGWLLRTAAWSVLQNLRGTPVISECLYSLASQRADRHGLLPKRSRPVYQCRRALRLDGRTIFVVRPCICLHAAPLPGDCYRMNAFRQ